ncbi:hypothetical protein EBR43_14425, partial [bacterium]|nr:hypothetical protein [bacterium]
LQGVTGPPGTGGTSTLWTQTGSNVFYNNGYVGIGLTGPNTSLDISGNLEVSGFIDGVIKVKGKRGEDVYWILDWKTTARGWFREKRSDEMVKAQLALYKNFWCQKNPNVPFKNVKCGFILLKKAAKPGEHCELFTVSLGETPVKRSLKVINNMLTSVKKGISIKNRDACTYCEYKDTEHCI